VDRLNRSSTYLQFVTESRRRSKSRWGVKEGGISVSAWVEEEKGVLQQEGLHSEKSSRFQVLHEGGRDGGVWGQAGRTHTARPRWLN